MPEKGKKTAMETAICSSITRAAGLGDAFWRANLRDVAVMAMSSDQNENLNKSLGKEKPVAPGMHNLFFLLYFTLLLFHFQVFFFPQVIFLFLSRCNQRKREKKRRQCMHG